VENGFPERMETISRTERILYDLRGIKSFRCWAIELLGRGENDGIYGPLWGV
jgi:hypothetical protein